ncbi:MAG: 4Fe-4S dicluster domain-containing protein [Desulfovibrio sp.]|jgi:Fe-S oxidoreductase|nr:4Fe-4S dicluster domain-containing protein [Desulfovibrio sp.]
MHFDQQHLHETEARCTQESPPQCRQACPFSLDVRAFMQHCAKGDFGQARRLLERNLPLPDVMGLICDHPCETACLRRDLGGSCAIGDLERFCLAHLPVQSRPLPMPPKRFSIAVLGAGLAGLAAVWNLSRNGYPVTCLHGGERTSALLARHPQLAGAKAVGDVFEALDRAGVKFAESSLDEASLAQAMESFDGVLLDADATTLAPRFKDVDAATLLWRDKCCAAGWLETTPTGHRYASASRQANEGRIAAQTLERVVAKVSLTASRGDTFGPLHIDISGIAPAPRIEPGPEGFTPDTARKEAERCLECQCLACVKACAYLRKYQGYPKVYTRQISNNASIVKGHHQANPLIEGCCLCGKCTELCPENFSMADLCLMAREDMVARAYDPPSAHEFAIEDMESACGPESFLSQPDPSGRQRWLLFPGCQLAASRGAQVLALLRHLRKGLPGDGVGLLLSCCGVPAKWAGRPNLHARMGKRLAEAVAAQGNPVVLAACASCMESLRQHLPGTEVRSVWETIRDMPLPEGARTGLPKSLWVRDPCSARHDAAWLDSVRTLARKAGVDVEDSPSAGRTTGCCGYGGLVWCVDPELADSIAEDGLPPDLAPEKRGEPDARPVLASCIMCRDRLVAEGVPALHLLDLLFPGTGAASARERGPGLSARRAGRIALRRAALDGSDVPAPLAGVPGLDVDAALLARLEERHILLEDVAETVQAVDAAGRYFVNSVTGHRLGSSRPRRVTFWVEYSPKDGGFTVHDAWCHRMVIPGCGSDAGQPWNRQEDAP